MVFEVVDTVSEIPKHFGILKMGKFIVAFRRATVHLGKGLPSIIFNLFLRNGLILKTKVCRKNLFFFNNYFSL